MDKKHDVIPERPRTREMVKAAEEEEDLEIAHQVMTYNREALHELAGGRSPRPGQIPL